MPHRHPIRRRSRLAILGVLAAAALTVTPAAPVLAGHAGVDIINATARVIGRVTAVGEPNAEGKIMSFDIDTTGLVTNEIRAWRITFVSGANFAYVYQVRTNTGGHIEITSLDGPLNGIAVGDGFLIEDLPVRRPTPQMRNPAPAPAA